MCLKVSDYTVSETIKFIQSSFTRKAKQIITNLKNADHAHYKKYSICRPQVYAAYLHADSELNGIQLLVLDHKKIFDAIKATRRELHSDWQLHDFEIVALQRPGTKPPFFVEAA